MMRPPAAVLFDLYDTLVHASADNAFYRAVPAALRVRPDRWLTCYRALGSASMRGEVPDLTSRVCLACRHAASLATGTRWPRSSMACCPCSTRAYGPTGRPSRLWTSCAPTVSASRSFPTRPGTPGTCSTPSASGDRVDAMAMSWSTGLLKPDPRIYRVALDALGTDPARAAFVGDGRDHELQGARRLGLWTVLIERDLPHTESARAEADLCCASLTEATQALLAR